MSVHYETVRVCGVCSKIYHMLDWARTILDGPPGRKKKRESKERRSSGTEREMLSNTLPNNLGCRSDETSNSRPGSRSANNLGATDSLILNRRTWRGHMESPSGSGPGSGPVTASGIGSVSGTASGLGSGTGNSGSSFIELDDYLRGGAEQLAARKIREMQNLTKKRVHRLIPVEGEPPGAGEALLARVVKKSKAKGAPKEDPSDGLYHGKVLLGCVEGEHAKNAINILEKVFYYRILFQYFISVFYPIVECLRRHFSEKNSHKLPQKTGTVPLIWEICFGNLR